MSSSINDKNVSLFKIMYTYWASGELWKETKNKTYDQLYYK